jgi:hypothetical protein
MNTINFPLENESDIDHILYQKNERGCLIDSYTVSVKTKQAMDLLLDSKTSNLGKIKIGNFFCNQLYNVCYLSAEKEANIIKVLSSTILDSNDLPIPARLYFLRFANVIVTYKLAWNLITNDLRNRLDFTAYFQVLKYILKSSENKQEHVQQVIRELEEYFANDTISLYIKMDIADIMILHGNRARGERMVDIIRIMEANPNMTFDDAVLYTNSQVVSVYSDSQNVHNTNINTSNLKACIRLIQIEPPAPEGLDESKVKEQLLAYTKTQEESDIVFTVLERVNIDSSEFTHENSRFTLYHLFCSLWQFIQKHKDKEVLLLRLLEEMTGMTKFCSSGHMSRFINVIQAFTDDPQLQVTISEFDQVKAIVSHYLTKHMTDAPEHVTDSMMNTDKSDFYDYISEKMTSFLPNFIKEYGTSTKKHILEVIRYYTQHPHWDIDDDKLVLRQVKIFDEYKEMDTNTNIDMQSSQDPVNQEIKNVSLNQENTSESAVNATNSATSEEPVVDTPNERCKQLDEEIGQLVTDIKQLDNKINEVELLRKNSEIILEKIDSKVVEKSITPQQAEKKKNRKKNVQILRDKIQRRKQNQKNRSFSSEVIEVEKSGELSVEKEKDTLSTTPTVLSPTLSSNTAKKRKNRKKKGKKSAVPQTETIQLSEPKPVSTENPVDTIISHTTSTSCSDSSSSPSSSTQPTPTPEQQVQTPKATGYLYGYMPSCSIQ